MEVVMQYNNTTEQIALDIAKERVKRMKKFYNHLFIFMIGLILYVSKRYFGAPLNFFPIKHLNETVMWC
ncbi:2TM domain-containing protein [Flavobacterium amnicola]|uniref:2TM domain-containing protein n=1 Tax=Flavobacterium amnicola TaxID=2506422 RepID=A0A4Q1K2Y7_9FLAO|nr:2TM domain-containing protein [Flavobacterium amnicola]